MTDLPIVEALPALSRALAAGDNAVLVAPPGAGKTTRVPLMLLEQPWCRGKVLMFEPRRMAARAAAVRMAEQLGEAAGQRVGFRIRGETQVSSATRIEVVTGGVLTRMLVDDPSLDGYSAVVLDEFHERNLDADLSLTLTLAGRSLLRDAEPLKLLVMSATLDAGAIAELLGKAPVVASEGRSFPVTVSYAGQTRLEDLAVSASNAVLALADQHPGDLLVFLPGQRQILQVQQRLAATGRDDLCVQPLYGALDFARQQQAIRPLAGRDAGKRKVVLATDIAETSLTIDGITLVIDGGYHRAPVFDARTAMTRLHTQRISQASATQRSGRAGRTAPGHCHRLWSREQSLNPFAEPEMLQADLAPLLLALLAFGIDDPTELTWLTPPPAHHLRQARSLLEHLGALRDGGLTAHGGRLAALPVHPRLGHMLLEGARSGAAELAAATAAVLHENYRGGGGRDLAETIAARRQWPAPVSASFRQFKQMLGSAPQVDQGAAPLALAELLAFAFPDRIARKVPGQDNLYRLSGGRQARLPVGEPLAQHEWLVAAETGGASGQTEDWIFTAVALTPASFEGPLQGLVDQRDEAAWSESEQRFIAERITRIGRIVLSRHPHERIDKAARAAAVCAYLQRNPNTLPWDQETQRLRARIELGRRHLPELKLPDCSDAGLAATMDEWLLPYLSEVSTLAAIKKIDLKAALWNRLAWPQQSALNQALPTHFTVPSGSRIAIDYSQSPPVLAVKLQEMFGQQQTPAVADGRLPLMVHLLSPARRPLQITQDLAGFWQGSYQQVKKEMKGRYPKHPWPDDPLAATPTRWAKPRSGNS